LMLPSSCECVEIVESGLHFERDDKEITCEENLFSDFQYHRSFVAVVCLANIHFD